jgi:hypothetical protein
VTPYPVFEIDDYDTRYLAILSVALREFGDVPRDRPTRRPSPKLCDMADTHALSRSCADIHDGGILAGVRADSRRSVRRSSLGCAPIPSGRVDSSPHGRAGCARWCPPTFGPISRSPGCWKGGNRRRSSQIGFARWFDPDGRRPIPVRDLGCLSSEARGTIPMSG